MRLPMNTFKQAMCDKRVRVGPWLGPADAYAVEAVAAPAPSRSRQPADAAPWDRDLTSDPDSHGTLHGCRAHHDEEERNMPHASCLRSAPAFQQVAR